MRFSKNTQNVHDRSAAAPQKTIISVPTVVTTKMKPATRQPLTFEKKRATIAILGNNQGKMVHQLEKKTPHGKHANNKSIESVLFLPV